MAALALAAVFAGFASAAPSRAVPDSALSKRADNSNSLPEIIVACESQVDSVNLQLSAAIDANGGKVDDRVVEFFLLQLKQFIIDATLRLEAIATLNLDALLTYNGTILTIAAVAQLLATLFIKIIAVLQISLKAATHANVVLALILDVDVVLAVWLKLIFTVVVGTQGLWIALIPRDVVTWIRLYGLVRVYALFSL